MATPERPDLLQRSTNPARARSHVAIWVALTVLLVMSVLAVGFAWISTRNDVELPSVLAGVPEVSPEQSRRSEGILERGGNLDATVARYGGARGDYPRYEIFFLTDFEPPRTPLIALNELRSTIQAQNREADSSPVLRRRVDGVLFECWMVPQGTGNPASEPYLWCAWRSRDELGVVVDRMSEDILKTLELSRQVRATAT